MEGLWPPVFTADDVEDWSADDLERFVRMGLLQPAAPAKYVDCHECGETEEVFLFNDRVGKKPRPYTVCAETGPVRIPPERLRCWTTSYKRFMDIVFAEIKLIGAREEIVRDRVWRLGRATLGGVCRNVFFARGLHRFDGWQVMNESQFTAKSVVFVPIRSPHDDSRIGVSPVIVRLVDVLTWKGAGIHLDGGFIESMLDDGPAPNTKPPPPARKRASRMATIELLTKQMMEHVRAASEHALAQGDFGREVDLLPRPTKRQLGRQIGVSEVTVGRCFSDPTARELRFLWEISADIERLLDYTRGLVH
jgi:hypothetical protein